MSMKTHKQAHVGTAMMILLALASGSMQPHALGGRAATPADLIHVQGSARTAVEREATAVEGGQALARVGCLGCAGAILVGGGASILGLIALASVAPFAVGACSFVCTLGFG